MKRSNYIGTSTLTEFVPNFDGTVRRESFGIIEVSDNSELNRLLALVFKSDKDHRPDSDLSMLMNKNLDPQVLNFLKEVLQQDTSRYADEVIPDGLFDDDERLQLLPNEYESYQQYQERMSSWLSSHRDKTNQLLELSKKNES